MKFEEYIVRGDVRKGEIDSQKAAALIKMSERSLATTAQIEMNDTTASIIFTISYDALREILEAMCLIQGYKVYSHEAYTAYLEKLHEEKTAITFDRLRKLRNGINYYGKPVSVDIAVSAKEECKKLCQELKQKYVR